MEQRGREKDSWEELVEKAIDAEAKASLQPSSFIRDMDQCCPRGNRPAHAIVTKSHASSARDPRDEPSEKAQYKPPHSSRPHFLRSKNGETSDRKARKEKKKHRRQEQARKDSTPATGGACKDLSHITHFNCDKKGHYADKCTEPRKDQNASED